MRVFILTAVLLTGCMGQPQTSLSLKADNQLNSKYIEKSVPLLIKIYTSKTKEELDNLGYVFFLNDKTLAKSKAYLLPGTSNTLEIETNVGEKYLHVVGLFNKSNGKNWIITSKLPRGVFARKRTFYFKEYVIKEV